MSVPFWFLLDRCVGRSAERALLEAGHDVVLIGDDRDDPGDLEILKRAHAEARILVTLDKDFGELAIVQALPHAGIIRLVDIPVRARGLHLLGLIERHGTELVRGAVVTIESGRLRIRAPRLPP